MGQPILLNCGTICRGGIREGTMPPARLLAGFQSLLPLLTSKLGPSGADFQVGGFVYIVRPCGFLQPTLLWGWEFLLLMQPPRIFLVRGIEDLFPLNGNLGYMVCLTPHLFLLVYLHTNVGLPGTPATVLPHVLSAPAAHLHPSYQSEWTFLL